MIDLQRAIHSHSLWTIPELGLDSGASMKEVFSAFADRSEGTILRRETVPTGALLFLTVPEDPHSGALHLFDRQTGAFSLLEFEGENNGKLSLEDFRASSSSVSTFLSDLSGTFCHILRGTGPGAGRRHGASCLCISQ
jgi:hypothetical protein